jgi:hypothetical protein
MEGKTMGNERMTVLTVGKSEIDVSYYYEEFEPGDRETAPSQASIEITDIHYHKSSIMDIIWETGGDKAIEKLEEMIKKNINE